MKFVKGMLIGGIVTAGVAMMYSEAMGDNKRKMIRKQSLLRRQKLVPMPWRSLVKMRMSEWKY